MSNAQVISATTAAMRLLLLAGIPARDDAIAQVDVTTLPLDRVGAALERPTLNLFLYQTVLSAAWRNRDATHARPGESPRPPLGLHLHYLLTAYGQVDVDQGDFSHRVLGAAVSTLHDHPVLGLDELVDALPQHKALPQVERMRISPLVISLDEMSKLWTTFQTHYRLSTAYEVSVVLIESDVRVPSPLPVLRRGERDRGPQVIVSRIPSLIRALPPGQRPAVRLGETLRVEGTSFGGGQTVRITGSHLAAPIVLDPLPGGRADEMSVQLPAPTDPGAMSDWAPGFYTLAVVVSHPDMHDLPSNSVGFALAPLVTVAPVTAPAGEVTLTVICTPRLRDDQPAVLVDPSGRHIPEQPRMIDPDLTKPTACTFKVTGAAGTKFIVRLRVDGVDSIPVDLNLPGQFDPAQTLVFT